MIEKIKNATRAALGTLLTVALLFAGTPAANAVPAICVMPTSGTVSGLTLVQDINSCYGAALSLFSGGSAPGSPTTGMIWWNTSSGVVAQYDGTNWNPLWTVDSTNHLVAMQIGGGVPGTLASASTTDLWSVSPSSVSVTGTVSITQLANADAVPGSIKIVTFAGILTLTQGTAIGLPNNGSNIPTAAGDYAIVLALTTTNVQVIQYTRATGAALSTQGLNVGASALGNSALAFEPVNLGLVASVASNQLTVSIVGANGSAPSSTNPVLIPFRSTTLLTGTPTVDSLQASAGMTVSAALDMGCTTAVPCRVWAYAIDSSGTVLVGLQTCSNATQIFTCNDDLLYNTNGNTTGTSLNGVLATTTASLTGKAVRIIGYVEVTWTSGTGWATTPSKVQMFGPGMKKPGDVLGTTYASNGTPASTSSSTPQTFLSQALTLSSAISLVRISAGVYGSVGSQQNSMTVQMYRGSTAIGILQQIGCVAGGCATSAPQAGLSFPLLDQPQSASPTYNVKYLSGNNTNSVSCDGAMVVFDEIMGALDPANDNGIPLRLVG